MTESSKVWTAEQGEMIMKFIAKGDSVEVAKAKVLFDIEVLVNDFFEKKIKENEVAIEKLKNLKYKTNTNTVDVGTHNDFDTKTVSIASVNKSRKAKKTKALEQGVIDLKDYKKELSKKDVEWFLGKKENFFSGQYKECIDYINSII